MWEYVVKKKLMELASAEVNIDENHAISCLAKLLMNVDYRGPLGQISQEQTSSAQVKIEGQIRGGHFLSILKNFMLCDHHNNKTVNNAASGDGRANNVTAAGSIINEALFDFFTSPKVDLAKVLQVISDKLNLSGGRGIKGPCPASTFASMDSPPGAMHSNDAKIVKAIRYATLHLFLTHGWLNDKQFFANTVLYGQVSSCLEYYDLSLEKLNAPQAELLYNALNRKEMPSAYMGASLESEIIKTPDMGQRRS